MLFIYFFRKEPFKKKPAQQGKAIEPLEYRIKGVCDLIVVILAA